MFNLFKKKKGLGAILNPSDPRDIPVSAFQPATSLPSKFITDIAILPIWNQQSLGACVGHAEAKLKQYLDYKDINQIINLSPRYLYAECKKIDGLLQQGTYPRLAAKILTDKGCATEKSVPNNTSLSHDDYIKIPDANEDAKPYKVKGYAFVNPDLNSLKQAIINNRVIGATVMVGDWSSLPVKPGLNGAHRIMIYGYDDDKIYFRNSWGKTWFDGNGYFVWKDYEGKIFDIMVYTDVPNKLIEETKEKNTYKYFKPSEIIGLKHELVNKLDKARELAGVSFKITSGYRTVEHNAEVGGVQGSSHVLGLAVDLLADTNEKRFKILKGLLDAGFTRLGIYYSHIHADISTDKAQKVAWYS